MSEMLFEGYPDPELPNTPDPPSADRKRTIRARDKIDHGIHPAMGGRLADNGETCGTCDHLVRVRWRSRSYLKCDLRPMTNGPGTDIRAWWPACLRWKASET